MPLFLIRLSGVIRRSTEHGIVQINHRSRKVVVSISPDLGHSFRAPSQVPSEPSGRDERDFSWPRKGTLPTYPIDLILLSMFGVPSPSCLCFSDNKLTETSTPTFQIYHALQISYTARMGSSSDGRPPAVDGMGPIVRYSHGPR